LYFVRTLGTNFGTTEGRRNEHLLHGFDRHGLQIRSEGW
jgi:hypothetical protein